MGDQISAGSFLVYRVDDSRHHQWEFWKKMGNIFLVFSLVAFIINLFLPETGLYKYFGLLWIVCVLGGSFIYAFRYFSIFSSAIHPLRVVVKEREIHFIDFKTDELKLQVPAQSDMPLIKKSLADGRKGYHLLVVPQHHGGSLPFLFRMRAFGSTRIFNFRPPFEDFREDLQRVGVSIINK